MQVIPITSPSDYFEITVPFGNDVWTFIFVWNNTYSLFSVDSQLNGDTIISGAPVLPGAFILPDFDKGYNFIFLSSDRAIQDGDQIIDDLGSKLIMYQVLPDEWKAFLGV